MLGNNYSGMHQSALTNYFVSEFQGKIKSVVARAINESNTEILGIDARIDEISELIQPFFQEVLDDYGLRCVKFAIAAIDIDDSELRQKYDQMGMDAMAKVRNAQADRMVMDTLGDQWAQQQSVNIMTKMAENSRGGGVADASMGLGMGMAAGAMFGNMAQQTFNPMMQQQMMQQPMMQQQMMQQPMQQQMQQPMQQPMQQQMQQPMQQQAAPAQDPMEVLAKLKKMLDAGLIEQAEYDAKKAEILSQM